MKPNRTKSTAGIVIGALLLVACPVIARLLYVSGMQRALETVGSGSGVADPAGLSRELDSILFACAGGLFGSVIGLVILIVSVVFFRRAGRVPSTFNDNSNATGDGQ